jgi:hypothetical protein
VILVHLLVTSSRWIYILCSIFLVLCLMSWLPRRQYEAHGVQSDHILGRIPRCPTSFYLPQHERFSVSSFWCLGGAGKESISSSSGCWDLCEVGTAGLGQPSTACPTPGDASWRPCQHAHNFWCLCIVAIQITQSDIELCSLMFCAVRTLILPADCNTEGA